jgi:hypothetical protein
LFTFFKLWCSIAASLTIVIYDRNVFIVQAAGSQVWTTHAFLTDKMMGIFIDRKFDGFNKNKGVYSFHGGSYKNVLFKGAYFFFVTHAQGP